MREENLEIREALAVYAPETPETERVPPGYKQTDVGVIPEDWEVAAVGDVATFMSGALISTASLHRRSSEFPVPVFGGNGIAGYTSGALVLAPTVVIGRVGQKCGSVYRTNGPAWITDNALYPRRIHRPIEIDFLALALEAARLNEVRNRNDLPLITQSILRDVLIALPPETSEQRAIAAALLDVDALISSLDRLISKKRAVKTAAMQQLLTGKQRLPGFSGEWETVRIGAYLRFQVGAPFSSSYFNQSEEGIRLVKNRDLKADDQVFFYNGPFGNEFVVRDGDVLIGMDGDFIPCLWRKGPALLNQRVGRILPTSQISPTFAYYALEGPLRDIEEKTSSTTVKHLSHGDVANIEMSLPLFAEQTAIAGVLSDMDAEIGALEARREKTRRVKQGMMQELLTGRTRLV